MALWQTEGKIQTVEEVLERASTGQTSISPVREGQSTGRVVTKDATITVYDDTNTARVVIGYEAGGF